MRKLKLLVQISVDGYVGGPNGDLDWRTWTYDDKLKAFANNLRDVCDTILLGRKMAETFVPHFENTVNNLQAKNGDQGLDEKFAYANRMVSMPKIVFSKTIKTLAGKNVSVENGDLVTAIQNLKSKEGKGMIVYGGAGFVSSLIKEGLIDEFNFFVNPVMINKGLRIFDLPEHRQKLSLINATPYACGIAVLTFELNQEN
jgi:dihydrofolate reductase